MNVDHAIAWLACLTLVACGGSSTTGATCGPGTALVDGQCVLVGAGGAAGSGAADASDATADGGVPNSCPNPTAPPSSAFDDFEDGTLRGWYSYSDMTGAVRMTAIDVVSGAPGSMKAMSFTGMGFTAGSSSFGAGVGKTTSCTDVSSFAGLTFWAKGNTPLTAVLTTPHTRPVSAGGECPATAVCYDQPLHTVTVNETWKQYSVAWSQFSQGGWGYKDDFPARKVIDALRFEARAASEAPNGTFELDIDDVNFAKAVGDGGN